MATTIPALKPAGANMSAATTATSTLQPLEKLTPRQQEVSGQVATPSGKAVAATAAAITGTAAAATAAADTTSSSTSGKKKRPVSLGIKFDPESPVNYKSPFMFGTPKATTTPKGSRKSFVSYQKIQAAKQPPTISELPVSVPGTPGSPLPNQGELFYEGSKWFWRNNHNIHVQIYDAKQCYVARCNVLEEAIEYPPIYICKEAVEESLDQNFIVNGPDGFEPLRSSFGNKKDVNKAADEKAKETKKRYMEQVAAVILEKLLLKKEADGTELLYLATSKSGAPMILPNTPMGLKLPTHEFRVQRKMSVTEFKRVADAFQDDLEKARETVAKAGDRSDDTTNHINIWESTTSCQSVADARRHTYSAQQKLVIVKRMSMERGAMQAHLKAMREEDAEKE